MTIHIACITNHIDIVLDIIDNIITLDIATRIETQEGIFTDQEAEFITETVE